MKDYLNSDERKELMDIVDESKSEENPKVQQEQTKTKIELREIEKKENLGKQTWTTHNNL